MLTDTNIIVEFVDSNLKTQYTMRWYMKIMFVIIWGICLFG